MLNLHATVRSAIQSVNPDVAAVYYESTGYEANAAGQQIPQYADAFLVQIQVQPPSGKDLRHMEFLNIQGTTRVAYVYSNPSSISRLRVKGGDILEFSGFAGGAVDRWLVTRVDERWNVGTNNIDSGELPVTPPGQPTSGWSKLWLVLQPDAALAVQDSKGNFVLDSEGYVVMAS